MPPDTDLLDRANEAAQLSQLKEHPSWSALQEKVRERKEKHFRALAKALISGEPVDQRYVDRLAGYFKGMEDLLKYPDLSEQRLKSALRKAELLKEEGGSE